MLLVGQAKWPAPAQRCRHPLALGSSMTACIDAARSAADTKLQVKQHLEAGLGGDAPAAMRVPLSFGNPRFETDHRGAPCLGGCCCPCAWLAILEQAGIGYSSPDRLAEAPAMR